jgi:hypothetical protein
MSESGKLAKLQSLISPHGRGCGVGRVLGGGGDLGGW